MSDLILPVMSSRVRLARNFQEYKFPSTLKEEEIKQVENELKEVVREKIKFQQPEGLSIILGEEDHIRIQCKRKGFDLESLFKDVNSVDDIISQHMEYAYDETYGYLTTNVMNVGTGLKASVIMHLPGLVHTKIARDVFAAFGNRFTVRGMRGENMDSFGNLYQISNRVSMGVSEIEILEAVNQLCSKLAEEELEARERLLQKDKLELEDRVYRSYGIGKNARFIAFGESMGIVSNLILGTDLGMIELDRNALISLVLSGLTDESIAEEFGEDLTEREKETARAERLRRMI